MNAVKYEVDFYGWTQEQARLLREGRFAELDVANVVEEIETLGRGERRELVSRLGIAAASVEMAISGWAARSELAGYHRGTA